MMKIPEQQFLLGELNNVQWYKIKGSDPVAPKEVVAARRLVKKWSNSVTARNEASRKRHENRVSAIRAMIYIDKDYKKAFKAIRDLVKHVS